MKISQNKNKIYVKSIDSIESDILSTVKRYLDKDEAKSETTIDNIATEVLKRVKEQLIKDGVIS